MTNVLGAIGNAPGSQGTVTVTGPNSTWTNSSVVVVGGLGTGTLKIENGGAVSSSAGGSVGLVGTGTVTVTGAGSTWSIGPSGGLNIGSFGTGTLLIENGGMVTNSTPVRANIGNAVGSQGTVMVTGSGSTWSNSGGLNVGNSGIGTLTIADGGIVTAGSLFIATNAGATGTLNIGAGAAPGTLNTPSVAFGGGTGTINFNHTSANYVFAPTISGNGAVRQIGSGTTILTGDSTYTGSTTIRPVRCDSAAAARPARRRRRRQQRRLIFNRSNALTYAGIISGTGTVTKIGASTLTLTGDNTYTGATTISAGTLSIGNGGTSGSVVGNIVNNAALIFNRSDAVTYAGIISGTGSVTKAVPAR